MKNLIQNTHIQVNKFFDYILSGSMLSFVTFSNIASALEFLTLLGGCLLVWFRVYKATKSDDK